MARTTGTSLGDWELSVEQTTGQYYFVNTVTRQRLVAPEAMHDPVQFSFLLLMLIVKLHPSLDLKRVLSLVED